MFGGERGLTALECLRPGGILVSGQAAWTPGLRERAAELGVRGVVADLTSWEEAQRVASGGFDVLVNNAGMVQIGVEAPERLFTELSPASRRAGSPPRPRPRRSCARARTRRSGGPGRRTRSPR
jgi:NAD(P)-dependent dehydrogenase (short-subunit alcohol dehydrogenase family)